MKNQYRWKHNPTYPIAVPKTFNDILLLTAIALDRGVISEDELHEFLKKAINQKP
jgi:hypothetical protein